MHTVLASGGIAHLYFTTATLLPTTVTLLRTRNQFTMYIQYFFSFVFFFVLQCFNKPPHAVNLQEGTIT